MEKAEISYRRVGLLDEIRGLCIIGVVIYHALYVFVNIFGLDVVPPSLNIILSILQPLGAGAFIFIAGVVSNYSRSNIKRGLQLVALGISISLITYMVEKYFGVGGVTVRFGILSLLGCSMLLFGLAQKISVIKNLSGESKTSIFIGFFMILAFILLYHVPISGTIGILGLELFAVPRQLYSTNFLYAVGLPSVSFKSSDYFPLIPWLFMFFSGGFFGVYFKDDKAPEFFYKSYIGPLEWAGKHSLLIYLIHQPIIMGISYLVFQ